MDRRSFLKLGGSVAAAGLMGACGQTAQKIIPYVVPPQDGVNPVEGWFFATTCRMCEAGCGIMVRTVEGRAKKVEGNPNHPINRGGVCARGQAAVQQLYHPERITAPLKKSLTTKSKNRFEKISWDDALSLLAGKMKQAAGKGSFVMAPDSSDMTAAIAARVLNKLGSSDFLTPDIRGVESYLSASSLFSDSPSMPYHDLAQASYVLLLGADIFENSISPVHYGWAYGQMRRGDPTRRGVLVYAGPRTSMTAAVADRFIPTKQGTLGILALGIAREALEMAKKEGLLRSVPLPTMIRWFEALESYTPEKTTKRTGVSKRDLKELAEKFMTHRPGLVIPGDDVSCHSNGVESLKAVAFLNMILGELSREKGELKIPDFPLDESGLHRRMRNFLDVPAGAGEFQPFKDVVHKAAKGEMSLGMVMNNDPVHSSPAFLDTGKAFGGVGFLVYFGCFLNDTARYADLILPDHHFLESWSAQAPEYPSGVPIINTIQPVVRPLYDTMPAGEALLKAAKLAGFDIGVDSQDALIREFITEFRAEWTEVPPTLNDKQAWEFLLQKGGWWSELRTDEPPPAPQTDQLWNAADHLEVEDPLFAGELEHQFYLHPYQTVARADGSTANLTWLQEMPEPMTSLSWGFWVEINPKRAGELGIEMGDILTITSSFGSIEAPAILYPGLGPETLSIPFGYGHHSFGGGSIDQGANVMDLMGDVRVAATGALAWRGIKVKVAKTGRRADMVREGDTKGEYEGEVFQL